MRRGQPVVSCDREYGHSAMQQALQLQPGDIIVLRSSTGSGSTGTVGHFGIFIKEIQGGYDDVYLQTGDGGAVMLSDQRAEICDREIVRYENNIPVLRSLTDGKEKRLDGWINLDKLNQTGTWTY